MNLIDILIIAAIAAVSLTLILGIVGLYKNSDESRNRSNKMMRLRVALQAIAIVLLVVGMAIKKSHGG